MRAVSDYLLQGHNLAILATWFTFTIAAVYAGGQGFIYKYKKRRNIPYTGMKFNTRNITYISMMVAVSVAITVVISLTLPITVFPPIRVAFEGIMIKITGMIFGPIVGIIVGLATETLTMMFVPSYIHVAYFLVAIGFGFWSGLCSYAFKWVGKRRIFSISLITGVIVLFTGIMWFIFKNVTLENISFLGIEVNPSFYPYLFLIMMSLTLIVVYILCAVLYLTKKTYWLDTVLPVVLICVVTELICTIIISAWGDSGFFAAGGSNAYISMVVLRVLQVPFKIIFNTAVLTTVYTVLRPLIKNTK
ncbi:ECF transporter S component [Mesoplasma seiffertii]|uniref:ECF transporter S component n=1 Tax=Mesoplasma seiffertii TaxID=28224 RepID=UPI00047E7118|nr:ECF transporter S component [Mesoplasma seiffertii]